MGRAEADYVISVSFLITLVSRLAVLQEKAPRFLFGHFPKRGSKSFLALGWTDGWGHCGERESSSADLFRWGAREATDFLLLKLVVLPEKGRDSRSDGQTDLVRGARSAKGRRRRGRIGLAQLVVN